MTDRPHVPQEMNQEQVRNILKYVEETQSDVVVASLFGQLGYECFYARHLDRWIGQYTGDVQAFLDRVNVQQASKYWERLEFSRDGRTLVLTGRPVQGCACAFADCADPPLSLCQHCCKSFQEALFGTLLGQPVEVTITASFLLGDARCNTTIHLLGK
ncbi:MAG: hypothetical protein JXA74_11585 [Anaerolineae bacterium]|nr:hypothetical protein [Anaerolineae bacterium]